MHIGRCCQTSYNSVFAVRFAHTNAFGASQTRKTLAEKGWLQGEVGRGHNASTTEMAVTTMKTATTGAIAVVMIMTTTTTMMLRTEATVVTLE